MQIVNKIGNNNAIDKLIKNAGITHIGNVESTPPEDMGRICNVNVKNVYTCIHAVIPHMKEKGGIILNRASIVGSVGIKDSFTDSMSKAAAFSMMYSGQK